MRLCQGPCGSPALHPEAAGAPDWGTSGARLRRRSRGLIYSNIKTIVRATIMVVMTRILAMIVTAVIMVRTAKKLIIVVERACLLVQGNFHALITTSLHGPCLQRPGTFSKYQLSLSISGRAVTRILLPLLLKRAMQFGSLGFAM